MRVPPQRYKHKKLYILSHSITYCFRGDGIKAKKLIYEVASTPDSRSLPGIIKKILEENEGHEVLQPIPPLAVAPYQKTESDGTVHKGALFVQAIWFIKEEKDDKNNCRKLPDKANKKV